MSIHCFSVSDFLIEYQGNFLRLVMLNPDNLKVLTLLLILLVPPNILTARLIASLENVLVLAISLAVSTISSLHHKASPW